MILTTKIKLEITDMLLHVSLSLNSYALTHYVNDVTYERITLPFSIMSMPKS